MITLIIYNLIITIVCVYSIIHTIKFFKTKKALIEMYTYNKIGIRKGSAHGYDCTIEFEEIERYKNGKSRVKIRAISCGGPDRYIDEIKTKYKYPNDVIDTSDVLWLERDENIIDIRRNKLKRILK